MSGSARAQRSRVLVIGSQGVLGSLLSRAFTRAGWAVVRGRRRPDERTGFRHVDLDEPDTLAAAIGEVDLVVNPVPDGELRAEKLVLDRGGVLINVSALPAEAGRRLPKETTTSRGTVVMNAGIAPGLTNLIAADLLVAHPEVDEVELVFTVSTHGTSGPAGGEFAHRNLTGLGRHRTAIVPLPEPFGTRRCLGFAERDAGWLGAVAAGRAVSPYVCIAEGTVHRAMLLLNKAGLISRVPRATFGSNPPTTNGDAASREPVAHWVAVLEQGTRIAARTLECRGDYRGAAESTVVFAQALIDTGGETQEQKGVFGPEDLLALHRLTPPLRAVGISIVDREVNARTR
jgi:NAD(P)-dependent dehydrogenase (short-subunit alcohol dehydrogenase family)